MNFAVIGTREPDEERLILLKLHLLTKSPKSDVLVTGGAVGVDQKGAELWLKRGGNVLLCLPWLSYESIWFSSMASQYSTQVKLAMSATREDWKRAAELHPAWERMGYGAQTLHARNGSIVRHSEEVFALPGTSAHGGGTAMGMRMALATGKPLICPVRQDLVKKMEKGCRED